MRTKPQLAILLAAFVTVTGMTACHHNDDTENEIHLRLNSTSVNMMMGDETCVGVTAHENTTIKVADENLIDAEYVYGFFGWSIAEIRIKTKNETGVTTILVTDHETDETETLRVRVTDRYMPMVIDKSNHPTLKAGMAMFLLNNGQKDALIYKNDALTYRMTDTNPAANTTWYKVGHATYSFGMEPDDDSDNTDDGNKVHKSLMTLAYAADADGAFVTPTDETPLTEHRFIFTCPPHIMEAIKYYLGSDLDGTADGTRSSLPVATPWFTMEEYGTGHKIVGRLFSTKLPDDMP